MRKRRPLRAQPDAFAQALLRLTILSLGLATAMAQGQTGERPRLTVAEGGMPQWVDAPAYAKAHSANVLDRSVFFLPNFGAVYRAKFESLVPSMPAASLRGIVIHNHGCGGQYVTETQVAQFYLQQGFGVVTPEFATRPGNRIGCPGSTEEEMRRNSGTRQSEGIYQAVNPARLAARGQDVMAVAQWLKAMTRLPIIVSGHSEGCRTVYSLHLQDKQMIGGVCIKQGLQKSFEHTWRWNTAVPMWQSIEEADPWVIFPEGTTVRDVSFERAFKSSPDQLTVVIVPGKTHGPLNQEAERESLRQWLNARVSTRYVPGLNGLNYETVLPHIQQKLSAHR
jgi:dienelactone hydrolase